MYHLVFKLSFFIKHSFVSDFIFIITYFLIIIYFLLTLRSNYWPPFLTSAKWGYGPYPMSWPFWPWWVIMLCFRTVKMRLLWDHSFYRAAIGPTENQNQDFGDGILVPMRNSMQEENQGCPRFKGESSNSFNDLSRVSRCHVTSTGQWLCFCPQVPAVLREVRIKKTINQANWVTCNNSTTAAEKKGGVCSRNLGKLSGKKGHQNKALGMEGIL